MSNQNANLFDNGEEINIEGVEDSYDGKIYSQDIVTDGLPKKAIIGFSNSTKSNEKWEHKFEDIYQTNDVAGEIEKFKKSSASNIIIIDKDLPKFGRIDNVDDLRKKHMD